MKSTRLAEQAATASRLRICRNINLSGIVIFLVLIAPSARAQGNGVVEGHMVNGTDRSIRCGGVDFDVVGLGGGMSIIKSATTDAAGRFKVDGLPTDSPVMIRANYKDVNYHGRVNFDASGKATVEVEVYEPTTSMQGIRLDGPRMGFQLIGDKLRAMEIYSFVNETKPPRSYMNMSGNFRFSKAQGIAQPPRMSVTSPGSPMPLNQSPLESSDGRSYYSLFPLKPGTTTFEIDQEFPYRDGSYSYVARFYYDAASYEIGAIPADMKVSGEGLRQVSSDPQKNFAVYAGGPVKSGSEVAITFSGGTPVAEQPPAAESGESKVKPMPTMVGQNTLVIGPLVLLGLVAVLWFAVNRIPEAAGPNPDPRARELRSRRDQLLNYLASLDNQFENQTLERREYLRQREQGKRQLRRISLLLKK